MKTLVELFAVSESFRRLDYPSLVEFYHFLDEEAIAANELFDDAHIGDNFLFDDEFFELQQFISKCNDLKYRIHQFSLDNRWEHREVDFVSEFSALGGRFAKDELKTMREAAERADKRANTPIMVFVEPIKPVDLTPVEWDEDIEELFPF